MRPSITMARRFGNDAAICRVTDTACRRMSGADNEIRGAWVMALVATRICGFGTLL